MNKDKNLLKEAIAEAKVLKQTAISNAKAALEESLTPHLKNMFETKLREMDEEDEGEFDLMLEEEDEETEETETEEETEETEEETTEEEINIEDMSEEDLKDFVESVIQDMVESGELEGAGSEEEEEVTEPQDDESDLDFEIEDDETDDMGDDDEIDVDALINEIKRHRKLRESRNRRKPALPKRKIRESRKPKMKRVPRKASSNIIRENLELKRQLKEFKKLNESLKEDFSEVNLLNAKLLYTNKIFKAQTLSEGQKLNILDSFDKATSIKEVKLIYETLNKSFDKKSLRKRPIKEQLGLASKSIKSPTRLREQKAPTQDDQMVSRFKKLAGLE